MFILDSLMISGIRWTLQTIATAADAEMNDDTALREQLLEAEMRRELGELSDAQFREIEADLLSRIREIRRARDDGDGSLALSSPAGAAAGRVSVEATLTGDFHDPEVAREGPSEPPARVTPRTTPARRTAAPARRRRRSRPGRP